MAGGVLVVAGRPPFAAQLGPVVGPGTGAGRGVAWGGRGGVAFPPGFLQIHLQLEGRLGNGIGNVVRDIDLRRGGERDREAVSALVCYISLRHLFTTKFN